MARQGDSGLHQIGEKIEPACQNRRCREGEHQHEIENGIHYDTAMFSWSVLSLAGLVLTLVGLSSAGRGDSGYRKAFAVTILNLAVTFAGGNGCYFLSIR